MPKKRNKNAVKIAYSESDSEYDDEIQTYHKQKDKILLDDDYDVSDNSEEEEVYRLEESDSEDEEIAQMQQQLRQIKRNKIKTKLESDLEDEGEDEALPDSRAWGSKKSWFVGGDVRDNKIILSGSEDEAGNAALEEKEMREIEKRRLARMSEEDYLPPSLMMTFQESKGKKNKKSQKKEIDGFEAKKADERVKEMHPECIPLFNDFGLKMKELQERIIPLMGLVKSGQIDGIGAKFVQMKFHIISNYLICGGFYKYLMCKRTPRIHHHPVMQRLLELQQFYNRLVPLEKRVKADLDSILKDMREGRDVGQVTCTVEDQQPTAADTTARKKARKALQQAGPAAKKRKVQFSEESGLGEDDEMGDEETQPGDDDDDEDADNEEELGRRAITYEMEKNKGLVAHRKKELKNPRVKHRQKYRRALIRRKGQVRDYKPPKMAYSGEMTGIRSGIIRSRKLK